MSALHHFNVLDDAAVDILRRMTTVQKFAVARDIWIATRHSIENRLRFEYPHWGAERLMPEIARQMERAEYYPSATELAAYLHTS
ncbi:MAG TPA: hypothetical protein VGI40_26270 [Pirellulaceae bacterium]|jgi:hypothetical protein